MQPAGHITFRSKRIRSLHCNLLKNYIIYISIFIADLDLEDKL